MPIPPSAYRKVRSNASLTNEEEAQVRRTVGKALTKLKAVESETARLQRRLILLGQRKKDDEYFIKVHQSLLSPIRRLLPEILQEVFCWCLPIAHNSVLSFKEAPLLLCQVCSQWRRIAYSTPALWSSLHIVAVPLDFPGAKARFEAFDAWLARSGILPLSISMSKIVQIHMFQDHLLPYLNLLTKYARRCKYIHLQIESWDTIDLPIEINGDNLPLLEVFHFWIPGATARLLSKRDDILLAPSLRVLSVHEPFTRMLDLPVRWSQLTGLDTIHCNLPDTFKLLSLCSNLETLALNIGHTEPPSLPSTPSLPPDSFPKIVLPKLQTLKMYTAGTIPNNDLFTFLYNLSVPALRHFSFQLPIWSPKHIRLPPPLSPWKVLSSFFQKLNKPLEEFEFILRGSVTSSVMELLNLFPGLKRLSLRCSYRPPSSPGELFNDQLFSGFIPYEHRSRCHSCPPVEEQEQEQVELDDSPSPSLSCLCPNLEVLYVDSACFSKHVLFEYLRSRLVDYDKYNIARLRRFSISFDFSAWEDDDMTEEIDELAEKSGLLVESKYTPVFSPEPWPWPVPVYNDPFIQTLSGF